MASADAPALPGRRPVTRGATAAVIVAQLLLRTGSAAVVFVVGNYVVSLAYRGVPIGSLVLGTLTGGVFGAWFSFDGLAWITVILAAAALASLPLVAAVEHRTLPSPRS